MSVMDILLPVFVQVILTFVVTYTMGYRRYIAVRAGKVRGKVSLREPNWPDAARQAENNYMNQFELPVLFYALMILLLVTRQADIVQMTLAWIFVGLRVAHAFEHLTSNRLALRMPFFVIGAMVLTVMWGLFMVSIVRVY